MSVLDNDQFDFISIHQDGYAVLTISDHLEWDKEGKHLHALQTKINNYLAAIENGRLVAQYPEAEGRAILVQIIAQFRPDKKGYDFLREAKKTLRSGGYDLNIGFVLNGEIVVEQIH